MLEVLDRDGRPKPENRMPHPTWEAIETTIRMLDRSAQSGVRLHVTWFDAWDENGADEPDHALCIWGGRGEYVLMVVRPAKEGDYSACRTLRFIDPARAGVSAKVNVLEGLEPDGYFVNADERCSDINTVVMIAKHFTETGGPAAEFTWRQDP